MDLIFDFDRCQGITNARFDGLDGSEDVTSVKEALGLLKIRNPAIAFAEAVSNGTLSRTRAHVSTVWKLFHNYSPQTGS